MARLEIRLFGHFEARLGGAPVEMPTRQTALLLALVALEPDRPTSRASLAALLWPSREEEQARTSLRQALYRLRTALSDAEPFPLEITPRWVRLCANRADIDAAALSAAGEDPDALERVLQRVSGAPLEGLEPSGDELETRLTTERTRLRRLLSDALATLSTARLTERRFADVEAAASRGLALDPFDEVALRNLMSALAHQGRRNAALDAYRQAAERLRTGLAVAPQEETTALWRDLRQRPSRRDAERPVPTGDPALVGPATPADRPAEPSTSGRHMRHVAVLHLIVPALQTALTDPDPEAAEAAVRPTLERIATAATRAGGSRLGGAGAEFAFAFGATTSQESPALSAALLALDLRDLSPSCGIHAGDGLAGKDWGQGLVAQVARQLAVAAAPGEIRLGPAAEAECRGALDLGERNSVDLPGTDMSLASWSVSGVGARAGWAARRARGLSRFVGRAEELAELERNAERARTSGRVVVVIGEPGLGKSRLVHEFLGRRDGARVFRADFSQLGSGSGLVALGGLVRTWLELPGEATAREVLAGAKEKLGGDGVELVPAVAVLLGLADHAGDWAQKSGERRRHLLVETMRLLLARAEAQTILVIEDAHWADAESVDILGHLVATLGATPVLVIVTCRPEFRQDWIRLPHVREIRLEGLAPDAAGALVEALAGERPDLALRKRLSEDAGGVPLYIEEVLRALEDAGDLGPMGGAGTRALGGLHIPPSIRGVLSLRIDRLAESDRSVLQAASIIGPTVPGDMLARLTGLSDDALSASLDTLAEADLLLPTGGFPARRLVFKHALTLEAAYRSVLPSRRQAMHRAMLELCQEVSAANPDEHVEEMADHARFGGMWSDAADLCKRAAIQAEARSSYHRAALFYDRALDALGRQPQTNRLRLEQADIHCRMRPALWMTGEYDRVVQGLARAEQMSEEAGDQRLLAEIRAQRAYFHSTDGRFDDGLELCRMADAAARGIDDALLHAEIAAARCQLLRFRGKYRDAIPSVEEHLPVWTGKHRHYRGLQLATRAVYVHSHLAACRGGLGQDDGARHHAETAVAIARETERPADLYIAMFHLGQVALDAGRPEEALTHFEKASEIARTSDLFYFAIWAKPNIAEALLEMGRVGEALPLLQDEDAGYGVVHDLIRAQWLAALAKGLSLSGDRGGAESKLREVLDAARRMQQPHLEQLALSRLALTAVRDAGAAEDLLHRAHTIATREGYAPDVSRIRARAAELGVGLPELFDEDPEGQRNARPDERGGRRA